MGRDTKIEYVDSTCNPVPYCNGCELYIPKKGIDKCYVHRIAPKNFKEPNIHLSHLSRSLKWSDLTGTKRKGKPWLDHRPRFVFLNDMGDSWAKGIDVMWMSPYVEEMSKKHIWLVFTKRPSQAYKFFNSLGWIPKNFYIFTSVTSQKTMRRLGILMKLREIDKDVKLGASFEPLWSKINLKDYLSKKKEMLNWVLAGGESGPTSTPSHPLWFLDIANDCKELGIPFFFKQWGEWSPIDIFRKAEYKKEVIICTDGKHHKLNELSRNRERLLKPICMAWYGRDNTIPSISEVFYREVPEKQTIQKSMF